MHPGGYISMARINIEEESWARVYRLAEILGISVREAVGTVACLWHRSQDLVQTHGTFEDLIEWSSLSKLSEDDQKKWIAALEKSRFASRLNPDQFEVHGNKIQIENRISKTSKASKGGQALKKKLSQLKKFQAGLKPPSGRLGAGPRGLNAIQCNAIQFKAEQSNAIQDRSEQNNLISEKQNSSNSQKASAFVAAYCIRFKTRWGDSPEIMGKDAGIAKRLAKTLGQDKFELYLDAFFSMPDAWLVKIKHPLAAFESKLNEIVVYANTGNFTTSRQVQQADDHASNMLLLQQVREGKA